MMYFKRTLFILLTTVLSFSISAQPRQMDVPAKGAYLQSSSISPKGNVVCSIFKGSNDASSTVQLYFANSSRILTYRGSHAPIVTYDERFLSFLKKKSKSNQLVVQDITKNKTIFKLDGVKSYEMVGLAQNLVLATTQEDELVVVDPEKGELQRIARVGDFATAKKSANFLYTTKGKDSDGDKGLFFYDAKYNTIKSLLAAAYDYKDMVLDDFGMQLAYKVAMTEIDAKEDHYDLFYQRSAKSYTRQIALGEGIVKMGWKLADLSPQFSQSGRRLYFYQQPGEEALIYEPKLAKYKDHVETIIFKTRLNTFLFLEDFEYPEPQRLPSLDGRYAVYHLPVNSNGYNTTKRDYFAKDLETGRFSKIIANINTTPVLNPEGTHVMYFNNDSRNWHSIDLSSSIGRNHTKRLGAQFSNGKAYGLGGFDEEGYAYVYSSNDIWKIDVLGKRAGVRISNGGGTHRMITVDEKSSSLLKSYKGAPFVMTKSNNGLNQLGVSQGSFVSKIKEVPESAELLIFKASQADACLIQSHRSSRYADLIFYSSGVKKTLATNLQFMNR